MALIIDLKPSERIIIGNALITNDTARTRLHIEGSAPILREKDIMREEEATTPCKRIYFTVQLMYVSPEPHKLHKTYFSLVHDVQAAAPSSAFFFVKINDHILNDEYYKALKEAKNLMEHERELVANAS
jgi:flagellar protein FlbT